MLISVFSLLVAFLIRVMQLIKVTQKPHRLDVMNTYLDSEDMKSQPWKKKKDSKSENRQGHTVLSTKPVFTEKYWGFVTTG